MNTFSESIHRKFILKQRKHSRVNQKPVHFRDDQLALEDLPFPIVLYPTHYGTFLAFRKDDESPPTLCSCSAEAIENYVTYNLRYANRQQYANSIQSFILGSDNFPKELVKYLRRKNAPQNINILKYLNFENKLCHECNKTLPIYRYCHEMYGTEFVQTYGWYINKKFWDYGINQKTFLYLDEKCPIEIKKIYGDDFQSLWEKREQFRLEGNIIGGRKITYEIKEIFKKVRQRIENEVGGNLGHRKIAESQINGTIFNYLIKKFLSR